MDGIFETILIDVQGLYIVSLMSTLLSCPWWNSSGLTIEEWMYL